MKWAAVAATLLCVLLLSQSAAAHPAGFTSVNRYIGVECGADGLVRIAYVLDVAELPSVAELSALDANEDGAATPNEQRAYLDHRIPQLLSAWVVEVGGVTAKLRVVSSGVDIQPGEQGLSTLRVVAELAVEAPPRHPADGRVVVHIQDPTFFDRSGWREIVAGNTADAVVLEGPRETRKALDYGRGGEPPRIDDAWITFRLQRGDAVAPNVPPPRAIVVDERLAQLATLVRRSSGSFAFSAVAALLAIALGAAHALSPGHGKALAAAYLVGRRARAREALVFGVTMAVAHTAIVFLLGCFAIVVERMLGSERVLRGLELVSAFAVMALGAVQLARRWQQRAHGHSHDVLPRDGSIVMLAASAGLVPCPSALALLLSAVALHRYAFGLLLVLAFSCGVAATLTGVGLLLVMARAVLELMPRARWVTRWLPLLSSVCVLAVGLLLCVSALSAP